MKVQEDKTYLLIDKELEAYGVPYDRHYFVRKIPKRLLKLGMILILKETDQTLLVTKGTKRPKKQDFALVSTENPAINKLFRAVYFHPDALLLSD